ncbi:Uncharacterised protein [uncultured archaeon]|nr:Uncharacterised protein [uncultured archaeon]
MSSHAAQSFVNVSSWFFSVFRALFACSTWLAMLSFSILEKPDTITVSASMYIRTLTMITPIATLTIVWFLSVPKPRFCVLGDPAAPGVALPRLVPVPFSLDCPM